MNLYELNERYHALKDEMAAIEQVFALNFEWDATTNTYVFANPVSSEPNPALTDEELAEIEASVQDYRKKKTEKK
jgi:hypothetical protein